MGPIRDYRRPPRQFRRHHGPVNDTATVTSAIVYISDNFTDEEAFDAAIIGSITTTELAAI